jgi:hypothetical protein
MAPTRVKDCVLESLKQEVFHDIFRVLIQPQGRHRRTGRWRPGCLCYTASSFSGLRYVRGSPIPDVHFRRYLADRTDFSSRRVLSGTTPAVPH